MSRPRKLTIDEPYIISGYQSGLTVRVLARQFNTSPSTIRTTLIRANTPLRPRGRNIKAT